MPIALRQDPSYPAPYLTHPRPKILRKPRRSSSRSLLLVILIRQHKKRTSMSKAKSVPWTPRRWTAIVLSTQSNSCPWINILVKLRKTFPKIFNTSCRLALCRISSKLTPCNSKKNHSRLQLSHSSDTQRRRPRSTLTLQRRERKRSSRPQTSC